MVRIYIGKTALDRALAFLKGKLNSRLPVAVSRDLLEGEDTRVPNMIVCPIDKAPYTPYILTSNAQDIELYAQRECVIVAVLKEVPQGARYPYLLFADKIEGTFDMNSM